MLRLRRGRLLAFAASLLVVLAAAFVLYGYWEAGQIRVVRKELFFNRLPAAFDGFRIIHISDLHTRAFGRLERRLRGLLQNIPADLLVVTGDLKAHIATPDSAALDGLDQLFEGIECPWGLVAVPGNHDSPGFYAAMSARGRFTCLLRNSTVLERGGGRIALLGVATQRPNDGTRGEHEIDEASWVGNVARRSAPWRLLPDQRARPLTCDRINGGRAFRILLAHTPDFILDATEEGIDLVLAGDTHGGQIRLPLLGSLFVKSSVSDRYSRGHFAEGATQMYVNPGIGTLYIAIRFLCPPEVTVLTLRRERPPAEEADTDRGPRWDPPR